MSLLIAVCNSSVVISGILIISFVFLLCCSHFHSLRFLGPFLLVHCRRIFFVEFSKDIGNPFSRSDDFTFIILYLGVEHILLCRFDSWDVLYTFEVYKYSLDVLLSFHSFLSLRHFFAFAHFFRRCFPSLGVFLLSSMSLRISTSSFHTSSSLFCCCCLACFFIVFFFLVHVSSDMHHDRTCCFIRMYASRVMLFTHDVT